MRDRHSQQANSMGREMVVIDGSHGEGGGQILRTALTLAALTQRPARIGNIRAGRRRPGLRPQHLTAVRAAAAVSDAHLEGDELGSQTLILMPSGKLCSGKYDFDVAQAADDGSAGSVALVLQTVLLPLAMAKGESHVELRGGTHVAWAPSASYLKHVFLPAVEPMGVHAEVELEQWGFYPVGGGILHAHILGRAGWPNPISLTERGALERVWGIAAVTNLPSHIPQRMANRAVNVLSEQGLDADIEARRLRGTGPGAGIFVFAEYQRVTAGFTAYGRKGLPAERVSESVCEELMAHHRSDAAADPHLADQLILPAALSEGESRLVTSEVTEHLLTNAWVVQQFLDCHVNVRGHLGAPGTIVVQGGAHA